MVKPKKHLGQHFLKDLSVAQRIVGLLSGYQDYRQVLEIGPGTGVLTQYLASMDAYELWLSEVDLESIAYLQTYYPALQARILAEDFLKLALDIRFETPLAIIGNFPYNISSQIFFKILSHRQQVVEVVGMVQKEVGKRLAAPPGNKEYGILSVLLQAYYTVTYQFTVKPGVFHPPPKVDSGVITLQRNAVTQLPCDEKKFATVVKLGFNQRRKTLRNALKSLAIQEKLPAAHLYLLDKRAEELSVADFVQLTQCLS